MCTPSREVHRASLTRKRSEYFEPNRCVETRLMVNIDLLNTFPELYLRLVFLYFQDLVQNPPNHLQDYEINLERPAPVPLGVDMLSYLITFLKDFGWLPGRYLVQAPVLPVPHERNQARRNISWLWDVYLANPTYIERSPDDHRVDLPGRRAHDNLINQEVPVLPSRNAANKSAVRFSDMYPLLQRCFVLYVKRIKLKTLEERYPHVYTAATLPPEDLVYKTRLSFAVTLFDQFVNQVGAILELKNNLSPRMTVLVQCSNRALLAHDSVSLHRQYIQIASDVLSRSPRFVHLFENMAAPETYNHLFYLYHIQVFGFWPWHATPENMNQAEAHWNSPVDANTLLEGSSQLLQWLNILPPIARWTHGMLVELLVEHLVDVPAKEILVKNPQDGFQYARENPFHVRNQVIWFVAVTTDWWKFLLSKLGVQDRANFGIPQIGAPQNQGN